MKTIAEFAHELGGGLRQAALTWLEQIQASQADDPALWISVVDRTQLLARIEELERLDPRKAPLLGIPFAVKDNMDVRGFPTTAACPACAYQPGEDAPVVKALLKAGAICMGKTNMDQFATGLTGTRSPYGIPRNPLDPSIIPGGSSSGSAVAVARGLVGFALGTDTAGSGRVPAALCGIMGWKPTRGLLSTRGVVPACRSLDCVSVFAGNAADIWQVARVVSFYDESDPWSRRIELREAIPIRRIGVPRAEELQFFGDKQQESAWAGALKQLERMGMRLVPLSFAPFFEAARLLYEGPWLAERYLAIRPLLENQPGAIHPVTREVISRAAQLSALDAFDGFYRLQELRRQSESVWEEVEAICLPTIGTIYRVDEVLANPIRLNSDLGTYTNFFNLLDLCGLALPTGTRADGLPFGISFAAPCGQDWRLLQLAGAPIEALPARISLGVFGAHMRGLPLEYQLRELGGQFLREDDTAPHYRMVDLDSVRPGVWQVRESSRPLALEVWDLPVHSLGALLQKIRAPLGLGRIRLQSGEEILGFLCEPAAADGRPDITSFGGWRSYLARAKESASSSPEGKQPKAAG